MHIGPSTTIKQAAQYFCTFFNDRWCDTVRRRYARRLEPLIRIYGQVSVSEMTRGDMLAVLDSYRSRGITDPYLGEATKQVRAFFNFLMDEGCIAVNPATFRRLKLSKPPIPDRYPVTQEQFLAFVKETSYPQRYPDYIQQAAIIAHYTGLRFGDVANLMWQWGDGPDERSEVNFARGVVSVRPLKKESRREKLEIPLCHELREYLIGIRLSVLSEDFYVLPELRRLYNRAKSCAIQAGQIYRLIFDKLGMPKHSFHSFRHGFVTRLIEAGIQTIVIQQMTGQTLQALQQYAHITLETKAEALARMNEFHANSNGESNA